MRPGPARDLSTLRTSRGKVTTAAADRDEDPVAGGRVGDRPKQRVLTSLRRMPAIEEEPSDHRVEPAELEGDLAGLHAAVATPRPGGTVARTAAKPGVIHRDPRARRRPGRQDRRSPWAGAGRGRRARPATRPAARGDGRRAGGGRDRVAARGHRGLEERPRLPVPPGVARRPPQGYPTHALTAAARAGRRPRWHGVLRSSFQPEPASASLTTAWYLPSRSCSHFPMLSH